MKLTQTWDKLRRLHSEGVSRVQVAVAQEFPGAAVDLVGAGTGDDVEDRVGEEREGGVMALGAIPGLSRSDLSVFSLEEWEKQKKRMIHEAWLKEAKARIGVGLKFVLRMFLGLSIAPAELGMRSTVGSRPIFTMLL